MLRTEHQESYDNIIKHAGNSIHRTYIDKGIINQVLTLKGQSQEVINIDIIQLGKLAKKQL